MRKVYVTVYQDSDYYGIAYGQLNETEGAMLLHASFSVCQRWISRLAFSRKVRGRPLFKMLARRLTETRAKQIMNAASALGDSDEIVLILLADHLVYERYGLSKIIKSHVPNSTITYFFQDLIARDMNKLWLIENKPPSVDLIISFDRRDANNYDIPYHIIPYGPSSLYAAERRQRYDVVFIGFAKDRLNELLRLCESLTSHGLECLFYIVGVNREDRVYMTGVEYGNPITYVEYLELIKQSKCLVEIIQGGGEDSTIRLSEAIFFDKLLLSNSPLITTNPYYDHRFMRYFSEIGETEVNFIKRTINVRYSNKDAISPAQMLKDVDVLLKHRQEEKCSKLQTSAIGEL